MHTFRTNDEGHYEVGYYIQSPHAGGGPFSCSEWVTVEATWTPLNRAQAAEYAHFLNGGSKYE